MGCEIRSICELVKVTSDHGLGLITFCDRNCFEAVLAFADVHIASHEVDEVCSQHQQLSHDRVVVTGFGNVAVGTSLSFGCPYGMWNMSREGLSAVALCRHRLLSLIDVFAIAGLRTDDDG